MSRKNCPDCGEPVYSNGCVNCNEAGYIIEQYADLNLPCPESLIEKDSEYWKRQKELGRDK